ncbi:MAG: hypothetical protein AAF942_07620 [Pseudomonadota bacterium]
MPTTLTKPFAIFLTLIWTASCAGGAECAWAKQITVAPDDVLARATKEQLVAHNRKVEAFCR